MNWTKLLFSFEGRVSRQVFWLFLLACIVIGMVAGFGAAASIGTIEDPSQLQLPVWVWIVQLALLWPALAIYAKRWHDQDKSGWWTLIMLVPILGGLILLIMLGFIAGTAGPNRFGDGPIA